MQLIFLFGQTLIDLRESELDRHVRKRARRMRIPERVTIVALRRKEYKNKPLGESTVEWQHRWIVRAHWKQQPYGPGRQYRKPILIMPYPKGPEDKPLIITDKVYDLRR